METTIQTIEPRSPEEIMDEVGRRTARGASVASGLFTIRNISRAGILTTALALFLTLVLILTQNIEELVWLGGISAETQAVFSFPITSALFNAFFLYIFCLMGSGAEQNAAYAELYFESVEGFFAGLLSRLATFKTRNPDITQEELDAEAKRLEDEAASKIALREAGGMNFSKALMWEFPPASMGYRDRDYLREVDITSRWYEVFLLFIASVGVWILMGQIKLLGLLMALQAFFFAR